MYPYQKVGYGTIFYRTVNEMKSTGVLAAEKHACLYDHNERPKCGSISAKHANIYDRGPRGLHQFWSEDQSNSIPPHALSVDPVLKLSLVCVIAKPSRGQT